MIVDSGASRPASAGLASSAKSLAFQADSVETMPFGTPLSIASDLASRREVVSTRLPLVFGPLLGAGLLEHDLAVVLGDDLDLLGLLGREGGDALVTPVGRGLVDDEPLNARGLPDLVLAGQPDHAPPAGSLADEEVRQHLPARRLGDHADGGLVLDLELGMLGHLIADQVVDVHPAQHLPDGLRGGFVGRVGDRRDHLVLAAVGLEHRGLPRLRDSTVSMEAGVSLGWGGRCRRSVPPSRAA